MALEAGTLAFKIGSAQAALNDQGGGLLYDEVLNVTWLQHIDYGAGSAYDDGYFGTSTDGDMTKKSAMDWAQQLTYHDSAHNLELKERRLHSISELEHVHYTVVGNGSPFSAGPFLNFRPSYYWTATDYLPKSGYNAWALWLGESGAAKTDLLRVLTMA